MTELDRFLLGASQAFALLGEGPARSRTEHAVATFVAGARAWAAGELASIDELEPFAWEGAGLAAALRGEPEAPLQARPERATLIFVGLGWARTLTHAAIEAPPATWLARFGESAWSLLDGQGFAAELFRRRLAERERPGSPIADHLDQGRGRALYFVHGGRPAAIARSVSALGQARASALWRGVGIASRFTDGLDEPTRAELRAAGGDALSEGERLALALLGHG
ncbi:DUF1702 family protein [Nannocystaceae bacterium ST9]